jgi:hypothetical protein
MTWFSPLFKFLVKKQALPTRNKNRMAYRMAAEAPAPTWRQERVQFITSYITAILDPGFSQEKNAIPVQFLGGGVG